MDRISKDQALDVPDCTDWLETPLRALSDVDSALRCQVCRDFYTTPMITSCSHTFCSLCIRRCLNNDGKCPACRAPQQEMKLRNNNAMEDLVDAFKRARPEVLEFARAPSNTPGAPVLREDSGQIMLSSRKRSLEEENTNMEVSPQKRRRSERHKTSSQRVVSVSDPDDGYTPDDGLVQCPICSRRVKEGIINKHIDAGCPDEPQNKVTKALGHGRSSLLEKSHPAFPDKSTSQPERLAALNFSMIKEGPLKKKLTDAGLSAAGNRPLLERRYTEWMTLWNANCDAAKPKTKGELKRELDVWEKTQGGRVTMSSSTQMGAQIRDKDFDGKAWSIKHDTDFQQLIANARRKVKVPSSTPTPSDPNTPPNNKSPESRDEEIRTTPFNDPIVIGDTPEKPASPKLFFDANDMEPPPSSQLGVLDKSAEISDIATIGPIQP